MTGFPHIAVVDDEEVIVEILGYSLKKKFPDAKITGFNNASEAQGWLGRNAVDLLMTDLNMPELNGKEIVTMMEKKFPRTPVIVISGAVSLDQLKELEKQFKNVRVFAKPLLTSELIEGIEERLADEDTISDKRIQQLPLPNLLHLVHLQKRSLHVRVEHDSGSGGVVFREGLPVLAEFNGEQSEKSFFKLLELKDPVVTAEAGEFSGDAQITKSFEDLYREYVNRRDRD